MQVLNSAGDYVKEHPRQAVLFGGGSILGTIGILKALTKPERDAVLDAAVVAEQENDDTKFGLSSTGLIAAGVILGMIEDDEDQRLQQYQDSPESKLMIEELKQRGPYGHSANEVAPRRVVSRSYGRY